MMRLFSILNQSLKDWSALFEQEKILTNKRNASTLFSQIDKEIILTKQNLRQKNSHPSISKQRNLMFWFLSKFFLILTLSLPSYCFTSSSACVQRIFESHQVQGGFILKGNHQLLYNQEWVKTRFVPASTFKIFHTLIGLELGLINPDGLFFHYEGEKLALQQWQKDMGIKEAIALSNVPAFQVLATNIGYSRMKRAIQKLKFGNQIIGNKKGLTTFWLKGPLKISPLEMTDLLQKLALQKLPFTQESQATIADLLEYPYKKESKLYTKTGLSMNADQYYGWIVGWINIQNNISSFALHIAYPKEKKDIRFQMLDEILKGCGII